MPAIYNYQQELNLIDFPHSVCWVMFVSVEGFIFGPSLWPERKKERTPEETNKQTNKQTLKQTNIKTNKH